MFRRLFSRIGALNCHSATFHRTVKLGSALAGLSVFAAQPAIGFTTLATKLNPQHILKTLPSNTAYNTSVILCGSVSTRDVELYKTSRDELKKQLASEENISLKAWLLGRLLLTADEMNDQKTVTETLADLKKCLNNPRIKHDEFRAWALGYIAALNATEYNHYKAEMLHAANTLTKPADRLWADVMNLQATARAKDGKTFSEIISNMEAFTGKSSVAEALQQIPASDWQAWAIGITTKSAALHGDKNLYQSLQTPLDSAITEAVKIKSEANAMLAEMCADQAEELAHINQAAHKL